jgi:hypothetical protein
MMEGLALAAQRDGMYKRGHCFCWSMISSENRYPSRIKSGQAFSGSCSYVGV